MKLKRRGCIHGQQMASGFKNSKGQDLDDLFYAANNNGGELGFKDTSGRDLGNVYNSNITLGYEVGFKAKSGTDIGYLRGNINKPTLRGWNLVVESTQNFSSQWSDDWLRSISRIFRIDVETDMPFSSAYVVVHMSMYQHFKDDKCSYKFLPYKSHCVWSGQPSEGVTYTRGRPSPSWTMTYTQDMATRGSIYFGLGLGTENDRYSSNVWADLYVTNSQGSSVKVSTNGIGHS